MVFQHIGILDHTSGIEDHLGVDRFARVGRNVHHVEALEDVADHLPCRGDGAHLELAFRLRDLVGLREHLVDALALDVAIGFGLHRRKGGDHQQHQHHQPNAPVAWEDLSQKRLGCHGFADLEWACGHLR
ncbi:hypothetical protein D3C73_567560 [compost metagenome]